METILSMAAAVAVLAIAITFIVLAKAVLAQLHKIGRTTDELASLIETVNKEIVPIAQNTSSTLENLDKLVADATKTVNMVNKLAACAGSITEAAHVATTATHAVKSSTAGILSVYEGVKQGIKTLRGS